MGNVSVGRVSLQVCWEEGKAQATALTSSIYPEVSAFNLNKAFDHPPRDLLRPDGKYIGISNEFDSSLGGARTRVFHNADVLLLPMETTDEIGEPDADE